jgi:2-desacetyl-2-hydroxyethyl bacteriochlorophyllide A dehydrogenase
VTASLVPRGLRFVGPRRVEVVEEPPLGPPPPRHLLVRTLVSAVSAGTELLAYRGELPPDMPRDEKLGALAGATFAYPFAYGYAAVGEVVAAGEGAGGDWEGRLVFAFQPHASAFVTPAADVVPVPAGVAAERAALLANAETAVNLVLDARPLLGERVLVIGQGVVGLLATALLARFPVAALVAVEPLPLRARAARALGAGAVVVGDGSAARAALGGRDDAGADLVLELSGDPAALDLAVAAAGDEARVVVGSWYGQKRAAVDLGGRFHRGRLRIASSQVSRIDPALSGRWDRGRRFDEAWRLLAGVDAAALITHRFALDDAAQAYALLDRRPAEALGVLLTYG